MNVSFPRFILVVVVVLALMFGLDTLGGPWWLSRAPQLVVASLGPLWAVRQLGRDDPPRLGWLLTACVGPLALVIGLVIEAKLRVGGVLLGPLLIILNNAFLVTGSLLLLRVLRSSGLAPPWSVGWIAISVVGALGTVAVGIAVALDAPIDAPVGSSDALVWLIRRIVGVTADIVVFNAALQMLRITLPMRGGLVARPYLLLTLTAALYMLVLLGLALTMSLLQTELGVVGRVMDTVAWCCLGLAGFAQAHAVRHSSIPEG